MAKSSPRPLGRVSPIAKPAPAAPAARPSVPVRPVSPAPKPRPAPAPAKPTPAKPAPAPATKRKLAPAAGRVVAAGAGAKDVGKLAPAGGLKPERVPDLDLGGPAVFPEKFQARALRPDDFLALEFTFVNLRASGSGADRHLRRVSEGKPAYLVVGFPAQHILERSFYETESDTAASNPDKPKTADIPVESRIADPSRLVFRVPSSVAKIPYTLDALLEACRSYELAVHPVATPPPSIGKLAPGFRATDKIGGVTLSSAGLLAVAKTGLAASVQTSAKAAAATPRAARTTLPAANTAARAEATGALAAVALAESRDRWYANRSPLVREDLVIAEEHPYAELIDKLRPRLPPKLPAKVDALHTAIEAPTRLVLSPSEVNAFVHASAPVASTASGHVELWHTRLAVRLASGRVTEADDYRRAVRAIFSPDARPEDAFDLPPPTDSPFSASLKPIYRHQIVHLSANPNLKHGPGGKKTHVPEPIDVDRLMLTSLGAYLGLRGDFDPPAGLSLEQWRHRGTLGRDHYVRVVLAGALYPFGHRAAYVEVSERKFQADVKGNAAMLRKRTFLIVREPVRAIGRGGLVVAGEKLDLKMPLKSARLTTLVSPNLDNPEDAPSSFVPPVTKKVNGVNKQVNPYSQSLFWPRVNGKYFEFHLQFEDESGALIDATAPLFFVEDIHLDPTTEELKPDIATLVATRYTTHAGFDSLRRRPLHGQRVQLAPTERPGDTSFELGEMQFGLVASGGKVAPVMQTARAAIPALKHIARQQALPEIKFPARFLQHGFAGGNPAQLFAELVTTQAMKFSSQSDRSGGFAAPDFDIRGLSKLTGPVGGDLDTLSTQGFKPDQFFSAFPAKLFGCIQLTDVLEALGLGDIAKMPSFVTESLSAAQGLLDDLNRVLAYVNELQEQLASVQAAADALVDAAGESVAALTTLLGDPLSDANRQKLRDEFGAFVDAARAFRTTLQDVNIAPVNGKEIAALQAAKRDLLQVLTRVIDGLASIEDVMALVVRVAQTLEDLAEQRIRFTWAPKMKNWPANADPKKSIFQVTDDNGGKKGGFRLSVVLAAQSAGGEPSFDIACGLYDFVLNLIAPETFLRLKFKKVEFTASSRGKTDVNVDFEQLEFVGVLSFVEALRSLIPLDGFSDPPYLDISAKGIEAGFSIALPNIAVGVFSLSNLSLGAAFTVPFIGESLSVRFNFCERSDPFNLTVSLFGGGGFFAVTVTPAGVQILEAAFEFGASLSIDLGVASGGVKVVAGVYYRMEGDDASLTGYFNLKGHVSVLGLISASIELALELTYEFSSGKCTGRATIIVEVSVLFFSASVEISCEKKFAGSNGDPSFVQIMAPYVDPDTGENEDPWTEYAAAFAA